VSVNIMLMFNAPYPSAPDFQKVFAMEVNLPAAYTRQAIISGVVCKQDGSRLPDDVFMQVFPDPGVEVKVDSTSGYYSVAVLSGWTGTIRLPDTLDPVNDDCDDCVRSRTYNNVTTHIENQNYAVE
jgi:hypothetical protein